MGFLGSIVNVMTNPASLITDKLHDALPGPLKDLSLGHLLDKTIREKVTDGLEGAAQKLAAPPQQGNDGIDEDPGVKDKPGHKSTVASGWRESETSVADYSNSISSEDEG